MTLPGSRAYDVATLCGFQKRGCRIARESGHVIMGNGKMRLVIPRHDPMNAITVGGIAKTAGLTPEQFRELL